MGLIKSKQIESLDSIKVSFDNTVSQLNSTNVKDAIDELNTKIINAGGGTVTKVNGVDPNPDGEVIIGIANLPDVKNEIDLKADTTYVDNNFIKNVDAVDSSTGANEAGKIVKLDVAGKINENMLPDVAISNYDTVADLNEAEQKKATYQNGDVFHTLDNGKKYLIINSVAPNFADSYVELTQQAIVQGVTDVTYEPNTQQITVDKNGVQSQLDLSGLNTKINNVTPTNGSIALDLTQVGDNINLNIGNGQDIKTVSLTGYVKRTELTKDGGTPQDVDKIPQLDANGKLNTLVIPDLAITSVNPTQDSQSALNLANTDAIQVGDVVVLTGDKNKVYMFNGQKGVPFENAFIELSLGDGTVKLVNNCYPNQDGHVFVDIRNIPDLQEELNKRVHRDNDLVIHGGNSSAYKVPQLNVYGRLEEDMFPPSVISNYFDIASFSEQELNIILQQHNVDYGTGDIVRADDTDKKYICANRQAGVFEDRFIELVDSKDFTNIGGQTQANKPVKLDGNGLIAESMLPKVATSEYDSVADLNEAEQKKATYQNGDVFYTQDTQKTYLVVNSTAQNFANSYIELTQQAIVQGVTDVTYDNNKTLSVTTNGQKQDYNLEPLIGVKTINGQGGVDGEVALSIETNALTGIDFKVDNHKYHTLNYMTEQERDEIIALFV